MRRQLIHHLIKPLLTSRLQSPITHPISKERLKHQNTHYMDKRQKRKDYIVCSDRSENGMHHLILYICTTCTDNESLCHREYFQLYHVTRRMNYYTQSYSFLSKVDIKSYTYSSLYMLDLPTKGCIYSSWIHFKATVYTMLMPSYHTICTRQSVSDH